MKKFVVFIGLLVVSLNGSVQAEVTNPADLFAGLLNAKDGLRFDAIDHFVVADGASPDFPSPGDSFVVSGLGIFDSFSKQVELTYSFDIAGEFLGAVIGVGFRF